MVLSQDSIRRSKDLIPTEVRLHLLRGESMDDTRKVGNKSAGLVLLGIRSKLLGYHPLNRRLFQHVSAYLFHT